MSTRTLTLTNTLANPDLTPIVGLPVYVYLQTPNGAPVTDLEGRVHFNGQPWGQTASTNGSGVWTTTDVYPGDLRDGSGNPLATPCQLVVVEGTQTTLSPPGFTYAASITVSTWYAVAGGSTAGMITMLLDVALLNLAPDVGAPLNYDISTSADAPDGRAYVAGAPVTVATNTNGVSTINLWPSSLLNPATTAYLLTLPDGTIWTFLAPPNPTGYQGAYNAGTTYHPNAGTKASPADVVLSGGVLYQCIATTTGNAPPNATFWQVWAGEPIIWNRTAISGTGIPTIDATGVRPSPDLNTLIDDPLQTPTTLDGNLLNLATQTGLTLRTITASATLLANDDWLLADATAGNLILTLPAASARVRPYRIIRKDATANTVSIARAAADLINGATTLALNTQYLWAVLKPDTTASWYAQTGTGGGASPITTEGDLIVGNSSGVATRLPLGAAGQTLGPVGLDADWLTPSGIPGSAGAADVTLAEGDLIYRKKIVATSLAIGYIGDSITIDNPGSGAPPAVTDTNLSTDGLTISGANQGVSGTSTSDWLPGSTNLTSAKSAFVSAGVRLVHVMLGTNDARVAVRNSAATYQANLQRIVSDLVGSGFLVAISYPPYAVPGSNGGDQDATANTLRVAYQAMINQIVNGRDVFLASTSAYAYFAANAGQLSDGIHPTTAGVTALAQLWANGLTPLVSALTQQVTRQPLPIGTNGQVLTVAGGYPAWQNATGGLTNPMTTQDDLIVGGTAGAPTRLGKGAAAQVLTVNAGTGHVDWENSASGFANPMTTLGDLITGGAGGAAGRLGVGSAGQSVQVVGGVPAWATQPIYAPVVTGATPGPTLVATSDGKCIMARIN